MEGFYGEIRPYSSDKIPRGWMKCEGQSLSIQQNETLYSVIGNTFGGDGVTTFSLPNLRCRTPLGIGKGVGMKERYLGEKGGDEKTRLDVEQMPKHTHRTYSKNLKLEGNAMLKCNSSETAKIKSPKNCFLAKNPPFKSKIYSETFSSGATLHSETIDLSQVFVEGEFENSESGNDENHENMQPWLGINYIICIDGIYPRISEEQNETGKSEKNNQDMTPYIGEIRLFAGKRIPLNWFACDGQSLKVYNHPELFSILQNTYGGDPYNFRLPDLRGRVPIGVGEGQGLTKRNLGENGGVENSKLDEKSLPKHKHNTSTERMKLTGVANVKCSNEHSNSSSPGNSFLAPTHSLSGEDVYTEKIPNEGDYMNSSVIDLSDVKAEGGFQTDEIGGDEEHDNMQPFFAINYIICDSGEYPPHPNDAKMNNK